MRKLIRSLGALALGLTSGMTAQAEPIFSATETQFHYGDGFKLGRNGIDETARAVVNVTHYSLFKGGDVFLFADLYRDFDGPDTGPQVDHYAEFYGFLSGKNFGLDFGDGFVSDVGPSIGIQHGRDFLALNAGLRANFNVPGFTALGMGVYSFNTLVDPFNRDLDSDLLATLFWDAPFKIGSQEFSTRGFMEYGGPRGSGVDDYFIFSPQVRWDIGKALGGKAGNFDLGIEYTYYRNKFGVTGVNENSATLFLATKF